MDKSFKGWIKVERDDKSWKGWIKVERNEYKFMKDGLKVTIYYLGIKTYEGWIKVHIVIDPSKIDKSWKGNKNNVK